MNSPDEADSLHLLPNSQSLVVKLLTFAHNHRTMIRNRSFFDSVVA